MVTRLIRLGLSFGLIVLFVFYGKLGVRWEQLAGDRCLIDLSIKFVIPQSVLANAPQQLAEQLSSFLARVTHSPPANAKVPSLSPQNRPGESDV